MQPTQALLSIFFTALQTTYNIGASLAPVMTPNIATTYPCNSAVWANAWLTMSGKLRLWQGPRYVEPPAPMTYQVPMQKFEKTEGIPREQIEDDLHGVYSMMAMQFGLESAKWSDYQLRDLIQNQGAQTGPLQLGTDLLSGFNASHPVSFWNPALGTFSNDYTGGATVVNGATIGGDLTVNGLATVIQDTARRKNESGEAGGFMANDLVTGPMLKLTSQSLLQAQFLGTPILGTLGTGLQAGSTNPPFVGSSSNELRGWTDYKMWEDLGGSQVVGNTTQDFVWYPICTNKPIKPWSWILRNAPGFIARTNPSDPVVFDTGMFLFGTDEARGAPAWGLPTLFSRSSK